MRCTGRPPYRVFGYKGKQVRDNIHSHDLVEAFWQFFQKPRSGEVYNMGGSRHSNCSMLEAIDAVRANQRQKTEMDLCRGQPHRRPHLVDQRRAEISVALSRIGNSATACGRFCRKSTPPAVPESVSENSNFHRSRGNEAQIFQECAVILLGRMSLLTSAPTIFRHALNEKAGAARHHCLSMPVAAAHF